MKIAIVGRKKDTANYEKYVSLAGHLPVTTLHIGNLTSCDALLLPGGGDITPAFFGESNAGSRNIDTELDILQFQALDYALKRSLPILGICKGMQLINVAFGGTITQHMSTAFFHQYCGEDQYHPGTIVKGTCLYHCYGEEIMVNSAHHQGIHRLGQGLSVIQECPWDGCVEAIVHKSLPVLGLQWHPERIQPLKSSVDGKLILSLLHSWSASPDGNCEGAGSALIPASDAAPQSQTKTS